MKKIEFDAMCGEVIQRVQLVLNDWGRGGFQILIDKYYHGELYYKDGMWRAT